jgi:hypothetical protein
MLRKAVVVLSAAAALSSLMLPGSASAQDYPRPPRDYGWQRPLGWGGGERAGYFGQFPWASEFGYPGCWRAYTVMTPAGPRVQRFWTCY